MDTDSAYIALAGESIDGLVKADRRAHYFRHRSQWLPAECCDEHEDDYVRARIAGCPWTATESCCFARKAFDKRTPGLFKVDSCGDGFVGLFSKTYYCFGAADKYSTKGLSKRHNDIDKDTFFAVLTNRRSGGGINRGFRVRGSSVMTYIQERAALTYFYGKRKVLLPTVSARRLWKCKRTRPPDDHSFTHMDPRWKHPFTYIVAGPTGCGKTTFVPRLLRKASTMIGRVVTRPYNF